MSRRRQALPSSSLDVVDPPASVDEPWIQCFPLLVLSRDARSAGALQRQLAGVGYRQVYAASLHGRPLELAQRIQPAVIIVELQQAVGRTLKLIAELKQRLERTPRVIGLCQAHALLGGAARLRDVLDERLEPPASRDALRARVALALSAWAAAADRVDRRQELLVLEAISRLVGESAPLDRLLNGVVREASRLPWTDLVAVSLTGGGRVYWAGRWPVERTDVPAVKRPVSLAEIETLVEALRWGGAGPEESVQPVRVLKARARTVAQRLGLQTLVRLPLFVGEHCAGALVVGRRSCVPVTPRQRARLRHVAEHIGALLDRAGLIEVVETHGQRLEAFQRLIRGISTALAMEAALDAAAEVASVLEVDGLRIWMRDGDAPTLRLVRFTGPPPLQSTLPLATSLAGRVLATGRPFVTDDVRRYLRRQRLHLNESVDRCAWLGVPFEAPGPVAGVIAALTWRERGFSSEDVLMLATVASCLGAALSNAALYQEARQRADELRVLHARAQVAQQRLQHQLDFTTAITSHLEDGILALDPAGCIVFANPAVGRLLGMPAPQLIGRKLCEVVTLRPEAAAAQADRTCLLAEALRAGETVRVPNAVLYGPSGQPRPVACAASPVLQNGEIAQVVLTIHDLSERRRAEEADAELLRSASLTAMGMQASSVVHELSQPLTAVWAMLEALREEERLSPQGTILAERVQRALGRMGQTISHLRRFARRASGVPAEVDLRVVVGNALALVEHEYRLADIQVLQTYDPDLPLIYANADELEQVVVNLLTNARDAMEGRGGRVQISGERLRGPGEEGWVVLRVRDDGVGMSEDVRGQLFQPLFTTKSPERGLGLGLAISQRIVQRHGGRIEVESREGQGACFSVVLPLAPPAADSGARH